MKSIVGTPWIIFPVDNGFLCLEMFPILPNPEPQDPGEDDAGHHAMPQVIYRGGPLPHTGPIRFSLHQHLELETRNQVNLILWLKPDDINL